VTDYRAAGYGALARVEAKAGRVVNARYFAQMAAHLARCAGPIQSAGGLARAKALTKRQRQQSAAKAAQARWNRRRASAARQTSRLTS
jgi:hypothetical protein